MCAECHRIERQNKALREFVEGYANAKLNAHGEDARGIIRKMQAEAKAVLKVK